MNANDRELGMDRSITRRDFLNGVGLTAVGAMLAPELLKAQQQEFAPERAADYYPPTRTGMRGSHPGSFEVGHRLRDARTVDLSGAVTTGENYDLVIVGAGMSGLSAAYFFIREVGRSAKVLILDNHDDFGGHAKRNEFSYGGKMMALNGGTLNIESWGRYNEHAKAVVNDIGIDVERYMSSNQGNRALYRSFGLTGQATFFDKETWGVDKLIVRGGAGDGGGRRGGGGFSAAELATMPLSPQAQKDAARLYAGPHPDYLPGLSSAEKKVKLATMSYQDFLLNLVKVDKQVVWFFHTQGAGSFCVGVDCYPALFAWQDGLPGFSGMNLEASPKGLLADLPGGHHGRQIGPGGGPTVHFPDGNATIARLLIRWLNPDAVPGTSMEEVGAARIDYGKLDTAGQTARVRLNSTVVHVRHDGAPGRAQEVVTSYVRGGKTYQVRSRAVVMACWNMFIPYLVPDLPAPQKEALAFGVKGPLVYTSVAVKNWKAFQKLGVSGVNAPTMYHSGVALTEAASLGALNHAATPDDPIALHLTRFAMSPGKPRKEQHRIGRADLLATSFETFERNIRDQLARNLGSGGFDPASDIVAIAVNRWPHGYAYTYNPLFDPLEWVYTSSEERPCVKARQPFGLITIANSDAAASPHTDAAMLEAHRAVQEVLQRRAMPLLGD
ncbi:MAG: NAD(P)-binding protein [Vicinamibacterales bacterium]